MRYPVVGVLLGVALLIPQLLTPASAQPGVLGGEAWRWGGLGSRYALHGLVVGDIDADGRVEVVGAGSTYDFGRPADYWSILEHAPSGGYRTEWVSGLEAPKIWAIGAVEVEPGRPWKIVVTYEGGRVDVFDGATRARERTLEVPVVASYDPAYAVRALDADGDGRLDVVVLNSFATVLDPTTWERRWSIPRTTGSEFARGDFDLDGDEELLVGTQLVDLHPDGTYSVAGELDYPGENGVWVNVDADPRLEYVLLEGTSGQVRAYDLDEGGYKTGWAITPSLTNEVFRLTSADVDGDGYDELLFGGLQTRTVVCYNVAFGDPGAPAGRPVLAWAITDLGYGVNHFALADADGDGEEELLVASGGYGSGFDRLDVFDARTRVREWRSGLAGGFYSAVAHGDVDGDGREEVVAATEGDAGYGPGYLVVFDAETGVVEWEGAPFEVFSGVSTIALWPQALAVGDVDGDGSPEIVVAADRLYQGALYLIDGATRSVKGRYLYDHQVPLASLVLGDVDGDGVDEIYVGGWRYGTGGAGSFLYAIDGRDGSVRWRMDSGEEFFAGHRALRLGDITGDGRPELVSLSKSSAYSFPGMGSPHGIYVADPATGAIRGFTHESVVGLDIVDVDGDGVDDVTLSTAHGEIVAFNGEFEEVYRQVVVPNPDYGSGEGLLYGLRKLPGSDAPTVLILRDTTVVAYDLAAREEVWRGERLSRFSDYGAENGIDVWTGADGVVRVAVATQHLVAAFGTASATSAAPDAPQGRGDRAAVVGAPYPNPTAGSSALPVTLGAPSEVTVAAYDVLGRYLGPLASVSLPGGRHEIQLGLSRLPAGTVLLRVRVTSPGRAFEEYYLRTTLLPGGAR